MATTDQLAMLAKQRETYVTTEGLELENSTDKAYLFVVSGEPDKKAWVAKSQTKVIGSALAVRADVFKQRLGPLLNGSLNGGRK